MNRIKFGDNETESGTERGLGWYLSLGKEWWVSDNWGLGVAGFTYTSKSTYPAEGSHVHNTVFGLTFSATVPLLSFFYYLCSFAWDSIPAGQPR